MSLKFTQITCYQQCELYTYLKNPFTKPLLNINFPIILIKVEKKTDKEVGKTRNIEEIGHIIIKYEPINEFEWQLVWLEIDEKYHKKCIQYIFSKYSSHFLLIIPLDRVNFWKRLGGIVLSTYENSNNMVSMLLSKRIRY